MKLNKKVAWADFLLANKALMILIVMVIIISFASPVFLTSTNIFNVIRQVAISGIVSLGFTIIMASGCMDLSVGNMLSMIGVVTALLARIENVPLPLACLAGIAVGILSGSINALITISFDLAPFIVTLAMSQVYNGAAHLISNGKPVSGLPQALVSIGQGYIGIVPIPVILLFITTFILYIFLGHTMIGRHILAIGGNAEAARVSGVDVKKTKWIAYVVMGICVAIASIIMDGRAASAQVSAGAGMEMDAIAAVVIGGTPLHGGYGNIVGTLIGCLIVGVINNGLNLLHVSSYWQMVGKGVIILFAIILDAQSSRIMEHHSKGRH